MSASPPDTQRLVPHDILRAYGLAPNTELSPITVGLINQTVMARDPEHRLILQKLHPVFAPEVNLDIDAVTQALHLSGMTTPKLVHTQEGAPWVMLDGACWRALTYLPGRTTGSVTSLEQVRSCAALVARFHRALADVEHTFAFERAGAHDTAAHASKLRGATDEHRGHRLFVEVEPIADAILSMLAGSRPFPAGPKRIIHGDLKLTNILLEQDTETAVALLDLDTLAHGTLAIELGDAMRSWCNRTSEGDCDAAFDTEVFDVAMRAYASEADGSVSEAEWSRIVDGVQTIALELAARFCADALHETYFGWDPARFTSRGEHNLARAKSQLALGRSIRSQRATLERSVERAFR